MTNLFAACPVEEDTRIRSREQRKIGGLDVMLETWDWDGIFGRSAILIDEQVADLTDDQIIDRLSTEIEIDDGKTISRKGNGFVFINYGFK